MKIRMKWLPEKFFPLQLSHQRRTYTKARITRPIATGLLAGVLCCIPAGDPQAQIVFGGFDFGGITSGGTSTTTATATTFQGQAAAVSGVAMGSAVSVADTGQLSTTGSAQEAAAMETSLAAGLAVGASHATTIGEAEATSSQATVANVNFTGSSFFMLGATTIIADFVMAQAQATCPASVSAQVQITGLVINGQAVAVTGAANQMVFLADGGYVIINEQAVVQTATSAQITVNGLHMCDTLAGVNVIFATATAGINCGSSGSPSTPPAPCDFVTGGGWITGTPSGAKGNFGVAGGIKNGAFWGHLNYIDHGNGMHVKATAVTGYSFDPNDTDCRIIDYNVTIDGQSGTARVRVCDHGEPGRNDIFEIQLSSGYYAGGDLGGSQPGGGNIQLHKCQ